VISPLLANLYLHYVLDVWVDAWRKKVAHGDVIVVRYADDAVLGFQHREEADRFLADLRERLRKFGLELHPAKTRLIEFGRYAAERRAKRGEGKPETFNFLGFTHYCGKNHKTGYFTVYRKTIGKRMAAKLKQIRQQLRKRMHDPTANMVKWLVSVVRGYFQYHAVPHNEERLKTFRSEVLRMWLWQLRRRSQRTRWTWKTFLEKLGNLLPEVEILHPYPQVRFAFKHPNFGKNIQGRNRVR
jgi:RNA-directed DNA polymerase